MGRSRFAAAALLALSAGAGASRGADLCEGCWEIGGRAAYIFPSKESGSEPAAGAGAVGSFRFKPFWSVGLTLDRVPTRITDGPDETLSFLSVSFEYTFRANRDQKSRPYVAFAAGFAFDQVASAGGTASSNLTGPVSGRSRPASDHGIMFGVVAGGLTGLTDRLYLRYEGRLLEWSSFGVGSHGSEILVGLVYRLGR